jgi:hypothetical protein
MVDLVEKADRLQVRVVEEVSQAENRNGGDTGRGERLRPLGRRPVRERILHQLVELVDVHGALREGPEPGIAAQLGPPGQREECLPLPVGVDDDAEIAVGGRVGATVGRGRARVARGPGGRVEHVAALLFQQQERRHGLEHGHLDRLPAPGPLPGEQRGQDRAEPEQGDGLVGHGGADVLRRTAVPLHGGESGDGLDGVVVGGEIPVRPVRAEAQQPAVHQPRVARLQVVVAQAELAQRPRPHVGDKHVGPGDDPQQGLPAARGLEVHRETALAVVHAEEDRAHLRVPTAAEVPGHVPGRRFDLDHVGAHPGEQQAAVRPHQRAAQINDADAGEGLAGCCGVHSPSQGAHGPEPWDRAVKQGRVAGPRPPPGSFRSPARSGLEGGFLSLVPGAGLLQGFAHARVQSGAELARLGL